MEDLTNTQAHRNLEGSTARGTTLTKLLGLRVTTEGAVKDAIYEAVVPLGSPPGMASFYIREAFSCGIRTEVVETPEVKFLVLEERK